MEIREGLTYDDVLLIPKYSEIDSRSKVDLSVKLPKGIELKHPIVPANMATVTGKTMAKSIADMGGMAIVHRFMPMEEQLDLVNDFVLMTNKETVDYPRHVGFSVGVKQEDYKNVDDLIDLGAEIICIDIAHGDSKSCIEMCQYISEAFPKVLLIAGNVATGEGAKRLWKAGADLVKVGVGPGCFAAGTRILMANGFYKNIEEIKPGEYVINKNGKSVKVINAFSTGIRKVIKLRNNSFYSDTLVTPDHQFWIGDLASTSQKTVSTRGYAKVLDLQSKTIPKKSKYKWKPISDARKDVLLFPRNIHFLMPETFSISLKKRNGGNRAENFLYREDCVITPSYETGYLFGTFLGDGHALCAEFEGSHIGNVKWYYGLGEKDIAEKTILAIKTATGKDAKIEITENTINVILYYKPLADFLSTFGKRTEKHLPEDLLINDKEYLLGLYDGLLDSDGHYGSDGRNALGNTSSYVIELFNTLNVILYGYLPNNSFIGKNIGGLKNCNANNLNDAYKSRTLKRPEKRFTKDYYIVKNLGYEELNLEIPVYDITVDCDTHSFIANNMIVHNSLCSTRIETAAGVPQLTALIDVARAKREVMNDEEQWFAFSGTPFELMRSIGIIADGGIKSAGDCVKALCFADLVMAGNIFAGSAETPGEIIELDGVRYKSYVGSSTHKTSHIEGVRALMRVKGSAQEIVQKMNESITSGCSYQGVDNLVDLRKNPQFIRITNAGLTESHPHDTHIIKG